MCTILCSMLRTSIFVQMYVNTRAGLRAHLSTPVYYYIHKYRAMHKGQLISECRFDVLNFPKNQWKHLTTSVLESKKGWNQQNKGFVL